MLTAEFIATKEFIEAFKQAASVALKWARHKRILECVKVSVAGREVTVEATNLDVYYRRAVVLDDIDAPIPLTTAVHRSAVKTLKPGTRVELTDRDYTIGAVKTLSEDHLAFPRWPQVEGEDVEVDPAYFAALASCAEFASESDVRPALKGVCHQGRSLVATDALCLLQAGVGIEFERDVNVPASAAPLLSKVFGRTGAIMTYDSYVRYRYVFTEMVVRLQDGTYPDVSRLLSDGQKSKFYIHDAKPWLAALDDVITMHKVAGTPDNKFTVRLRQEGHTVTLSAHGTGSSFSTTLEVGGPVEDWEYVTNATHLRKALVHAVGSVAVCAGAANQALLLESEGRKALVSPVLSR